MLTDQRTWKVGWVGWRGAWVSSASAPPAEVRYEGSHLLAGSRFHPMKFLFGVFSFSKWTRYCVLNLYNVYVEKESTHGFPYRRRRRRTPPPVCFFLATLMYGCCSKDFCYSIWNCSHLWAWQGNQPTPSWTRIVSLFSRRKPSHTFLQVFSTGREECSWQLLHGCTGLGFRV